MKKPLLIMTALFLATTGAMAGDPYIALEKEYRNAVPHPRQKVPKAKALVIRANSLLKGDPTCEQMRQASKLLNKAVDMYVQANVFSGAQRVGRGGVKLAAMRAAWLEGFARQGKCRKG